MSIEPNQLDWFRDHLAAYLAGGLTPAERERLERISQEDESCRTELEEVMALDASLHRAAGVESIVAGLEDRVIAALDAQRRWTIHPLVRHAAIATAACVTLGTFGYLGSQAMEGDRLWAWNERAKSAANLTQIGDGLILYSNETKDLFARSHRSDHALALADADGDGIADSSLLKLPVGSNSGVNYYGAVPVIGSDGADATRARDLREKIDQESVSAVVTADASKNENKIVSAPGAVQLNTPQSYYDPSSTITPFRWIAPSGTAEADFSFHGGSPASNVGKAGESWSDRKLTLKDATVSGGMLGTVTIPSKGTILLGGQMLALAPNDGGAVNAPATTQPSAVEARKIIRTGTLEFEVDRFDSAAAVIGKIVSEQGGFVATTTSDKLANGKVRGSIVVRVPPGQLDAFVMQLRALGDLKSQQIGSQDIGKEYTDLESELRADRAMEERLLDLIKNGKGEIKDLLAAEKELAEWRGKIEKIIGQMKYYDNQVALSTLTISLLEKDIQTAAATVEQETITAGIETDDVEKARTAALSILADAKARIVSADLKRLDAGQAASTIVADIPPDASGPVVDRMKQLGKVARLDASKSTTTDPNNPATPATRTEKRDSRLTLSLYNLANVAPRQTSTVNLAATDVESAYAAIIAKVLKAGGRVVSGGSTQSHADASRASAQIEVPAEAADGLLLDMKSLGQVISVAETESTDTASVTSAKHGFAINVVPAAALPAKESATFRVETADVEQAAANVQARLMQSGARVLDHATQAVPSGVSTATLTVELPFDKSADAYVAVRESGKVLAVSTAQDAGAPSGVLAKCRVAITFTSTGPITGDTGGLLANLRNGLSLSAKGLLYSVQLIVIGLCFVLPWLLVIGACVKLWRRRKVRTA